MTQPIYEYENKDKFGSRSVSYYSTIVYETEEQAKICALDAWNDIKSEGDTLLNITFRQLIIHYQ